MKETDVVPAPTELIKIVFFFAAVELVRSILYFLNDTERMIFRSAALLRTQKRMKSRIFIFEIPHYL